MEGQGSGRKKTTAPRRREDMIKVEAKDGVELAVKVIFGDDFGLDVGLLEAVVDTADVPALAEAVRPIRYNYFDGSRVAEALLKLHDEGCIMRVDFGREMSPVLYIHVPYWTNQATNCSNPYRGNRRLSEEERKGIVARVMEELSKCQPDELDALDIDKESLRWVRLPRSQWGETDKIRAWWD